MSSPVAIIIYHYKIFSINVRLQLQKRSRQLAVIRWQLKTKNA